MLRNCGAIDPQRIEDYIADDGYQALAQVLKQANPEAVIQTLKTSGLRGRGGAGFPDLAQVDGRRGRPPATSKYVVCNADEGDPGAFMDRSVLEGDPHSVIEGMAIAAATIGAQAGYIYVRAEYPLAVERLEIALAQARQCGLLGENILGSGFDFELEIRMGSGAFVCGEETALMTSIEGNRGEPRPRPPFPAEKGLWHKPTLLNNVETYANVPGDRAAAAAIGTLRWAPARARAPRSSPWPARSRIPGLVEVPIGMPLGDLIYDIGGGMLVGQGVQGGPDRRPLGRLHPQAAPERARSTTNRSPNSARSWARAA